MQIFALSNMHNMMFIVHIKSILFVLNFMYIQEGFELHLRALKYL